MLYLSPGSLAPGINQRLSCGPPSCLHGWQSDGRPWQQAPLKSAVLAWTAAAAGASSRRLSSWPTTRSAAQSQQQSQTQQHGGGCEVGSMSPSSSSSSDSSSRPPSSEQEALLRRLAGSYPSALMLPGAALPPLHTAHHFINLTNGLEALPLLTRLGLPHSCVRLRSTAMEQQELEHFVGEVDAGLLMAAALGHTVVVWDCGSRSSSHGAPRALWHGLELLRFVLVRSWWGVRPVSFVKGHNLSQDFEAVARSFSQRTSRRIKYYRQFVPPGAAPGVALYGAYRYTPRDGDVAHWVGLAQQYAGQGTLQGSRRQQGGTRVDAAAVAAAMLEEDFALLGPGVSHEELLNLKQQGVCP